MTDYTKKAIRGAGIVFVMNILAAFVNYLFRMILARELTLYEFGLFYGIFNLFGLVTLFKDLGLGQALVKYISEFKVHGKIREIKGTILTVFFIHMITSVLIGLCFIIFSDWLAIYFFHDLETSFPIKLLALFVLLSPLINTFKITFQGFQKMKYYSSVDFLKGFFILIGSFILLRLGYGLYAPIISYILVYILPFVWFFPLFKKKVFPNFFQVNAKLNNKLTKKLFKFGIPVILTGAAGIIFAHTDTIIITLFRSLEEVGLYNAAMPTSKLLWRFSMAMVGVLIPLSSELWAKNDFKRLKVGMDLIYKYIFVIILPLSVIMFIYAEEILGILFSTDFVTAANTLRILAIGVIILTIAKINNAVLTGIGKPKLVSKIMLGSAGFNLIGNLILIPIFGIEGAAISTVLAFTVVMYFSSSRLNKVLSLKFPWANVMKTSFVILFFVIIIYLTKSIIQSNVWIELIVPIIISGIIYILLIFILRVITIRELGFIIKKVLK